jgi:hypothetical protein
MESPPHANAHGTCDLSRELSPEGGYYLYIYTYPLPTTEVVSPSLPTGNDFTYSHT